jgi:hypothetical protein
MDTAHLEENFSAVLKDVSSMRPSREGPFITKCCLVSMPSPERLKVDYKQYIDEDDDEREAGEEEDDEEKEKEGGDETAERVVKVTSGIVG